MNAPHSIEAEQSVIGCVLLNPDCLDQINLQSGEFYNGANRAILDTIRAMKEKPGAVVDSVTLANRLDAAGTLQDVGGLEYIAELLETVPHSRHVQHYAAIVREKAQRRAIIAACQEGIEAAQSAPEVSEAIGGMEAALLEVWEGASEDGIFTAADAVDLLEERERNPMAVHSTGLRTLDERVRGGFRQGQLIVVGGRPGGGKSVFVGQVAATFAGRSEPALIVSLEMDRGELAERFDKSIDRATFRGLPVMFVESAFEAQRIAAVIRLAKRKHGIRLAVLDYLQLTETTGKKDSRERQVAEVSRLMKRLAGELQIPIIAACQLNRGSDKENRLPRLSDLRESGAIEQDADVVLLLHRSEDDAKCIIAKQRNGSTGMLSLDFIGAEFRFADAESFPPFAKDYA